MTIHTIHALIFMITNFSIIQNSTYCSVNINGCDNSIIIVINEYNINEILT